MARKPSTHRQPLSEDEDARACGAASESVPRLNNVGGVTPELMYFGADYLVLNLLPLVHETETRSLDIIGKLFGSDDGEIVWGDGLKLSKFLSDKTRGRPRLYFSSGRHNLFCIERVDEDSDLKMNLGYKYDYRLSFYSAFFASIRLGLFRPEDVISLILDDIRRSRILCSVSRLDVCADIRNMQVVEVFNGVEILSKDKAKKFSFLEADQALTEVETIYYGSSPTDWQGRIYDKRLEITKENPKRNKPSKEDLFPDYFDDTAPITRVEVEMRGACRDFEIDLKAALDIEVQLGLFCSFLQGKYCKWAVAEFVRREMRDRGFALWDVKRKTLTTDRLSNMPAIWQYRSRGVNLSERVGRTLEELNTICEELPNTQPSDDVKYAGCE
ncbi:hypothetical protein H6770_02805 [Candidatus Peribacteria bacterium]|nr:hypothetical protein [Candidatus Peribacteria bacterium]